MARGAKSAQAAGKVSFAILISRILGLVRDQFFAKIFGAGLYNDAWLVALRIPNLMRDLFAEGALSSAFVPTFTEILRREGRARAWHLANLVLSGLMVLTGLIAIVLFAFSEVFVHLLAAGFSDVPGKVEITATLVRILAPFLTLVAMASVAMGILNTLNHYFLPALAPAFFNVALILAAIFLVPFFEEQGWTPIYAMGIAALVGGILQYVVQLPILRKEGFRFRFSLDLKDPGIRKILRLIGPAVLGVSAVQINVLVNTQLASFLQDNGPVSWLSYAFRIMYLPIGLFGVAVGVVNLREVSVFAAQKQLSSLRETVANSLKLISFLAVPSTVGLIMLAPLIIDVLFERGDFTAGDTYFTSWALAAYALGLLGYSCNKVFVPTFYALDDTRTPVRITLIAVFVNFTVNVALILLFPVQYKFVGLALGTSLSVGFSSTLLAYALYRRVGSLREYFIARAIVRNFLCAGVMGVAIYLLQSYFRGIWTSMVLGQELITLIVSISLGALLYWLLSNWWGIEEAQYLKAALLKKIR